MDWAVGDEAGEERGEGPPSLSRSGENSRGPGRPEDCVPTAVSGQSFPENSPLPPSPASWPGPLVHQLWKVRWGSFLQTQTHPHHRHTNTQSGEGLRAGFRLSQKHPLRGWLASWDLCWALASRSSCSWKRTRCLWAEVWGAPHASRSSWGRRLAGVSAVY